jgi:hypothetical protein
MTLLVLAACSEMAWTERSSWCRSCHNAATRHWRFKETIAGPQDAGRAARRSSRHTVARKETEVFRRKRKPPDTPFNHAGDCKLIAIDPDLRTEWSDLGYGSWRGGCVCTFEVWSEPIVDDRVRLDPLDPKTSRHLGQCEYSGETDAGMLQVPLRSPTRATTTGSSAAAAAPAGRLRTTPRAAGDHERWTYATCQSVSS